MKIVLHPDVENDLITPEAEKIIIRFLKYRTDKKGEDFAECEGGFLRWKPDPAIRRMAEVRVVFKRVEDTVYVAAITGDKDDQFYRIANRRIREWGK